MTLHINTLPFTYIAINSRGQPLIAVYDRPPGRSNRGRLSHMLREFKRALPSADIRTVVWWPAHVINDPLCALFAPIKH